MIDVQGGEGGPNRPARTTVDDAAGGPERHGTGEEEGPAGAEEVVLDTSRFPDLREVVVHPTDHSSPRRVSDLKTLSSSVPGDEMLNRLLGPDSSRRLPGP